MVNISYKPYTEKFAMVSSGAGQGQVEYHGMAEPGSGTTANVWLIKKYTYDTDGVNTEILWADGSRDNNKAWQSRTSYTYK